MISIVPNEVSEAIYKKVDQVLETRPELKGDRENIFRFILEHYDKFGEIPDFQLHICSNIKEKE